VTIRLGALTGLQTPGRRLVMVVLKVGFWLFEVNPTVDITKIAKKI
jgi:hypothetical protein